MINCALICTKVEGLQDKNSCRFCEMNKLNQSLVEQILSMGIHIFFSMCSLFTSSLQNNIYGVIFNLPFIVNSMLLHAFVLLLTL